MNKAIIIALLIVPNAYSLTITDGSITLRPSDVSFWFAGDGFAITGWDDSFSAYCGACFAPFQLVQPISQFSIGDGAIVLSGNTYISKQSFPGQPDYLWGTGGVLLQPVGTLPTVTGPAVLDVLFTVDVSFCVSDAGLIDPRCYFATGTAIVRYQVVATGTPDLLYQPLPTVDIVAPEPSTGVLALNALGGLICGLHRRQCWRNFLRMSIVARWRSRKRWMSLSDAA